MSPHLIRTAITVGVLALVGLVGCQSDRETPTPGTCAPLDHQCHEQHPDQAPAGCAPTDHACHERKAAEG